MVVIALLKKLVRIRGAQPDDDNDDDDDDVAVFAFCVLRFAGNISRELEIDSSHVKHVK